MTDTKNYREREYLGAAPATMMLNIIDAAMDALNDTDRARVARAFANKYANEVTHPDAPDLTTEQWKVLRCLADGMSTTEMSKHLGAGRRTIETYIHALIGKLNVANRTHAVAEAFRRGML
jgi:DNA-binding NarL/FixJ family response regulator